MTGTLSKKKKMKKSSPLSSNSMAVATTVAPQTSKLPLFIHHPFNYSSKSMSRTTCLLSAMSLVLCFLGFFYFYAVVWNWALSWLVVSPPPPLLPPPQLYTYEIINEFPHDPDAFTQGLVYGGNDTLYESTGLYGRSSVREVLLQTGKDMTLGKGRKSGCLFHLEIDPFVQALQQMKGSYFGEGLTLLGGRLFQVTWLQKVGFVYDRFNLSKWKKFTHQMQDGWGLTTDGKVLFGSDGSSTLYQIDPNTLKEIQKVTVKYEAHEVFNLNELEYVNGEVWANVWTSDCIARVSPKDGLVLGWILLHNLRNGLISTGYKGIDVLNGIAWDEENNRLFVTGKLWPKLYEIKVKQLLDPSHYDVENICLKKY